MKYERKFVNISAFRRAALLSVSRRDTARSVALLRGRKDALLSDAEVTICKYKWLIITSQRAWHRVMGKQHFHVMEAIRKMEPAWVKTCGSNFRLTSRTIVQPNGGTREVPCYQLTKTECLYIAMSQRAWHRVT